MSSSTRFLGTAQTAATSTGGRRPLRSTIAAGIAHQDINSQLIGPTQASTTSKEQWNTFVNLVWNPVAFITTGVEYMYGKRIVVANGKGQEQVLIAKWRVAF